MEGESGQVEEFSEEVLKQTTLLRSKPLTRMELRRVFERADDLGVLAGAA